MKNSIKILFIYIFILFPISNITAQDSKNMADDDAAQIEKLCDQYNQMIDDDLNTNTQNDTIKYLKIQKFTFPEKFGYYRFKADKTDSTLFESKTLAHLSRAGDYFVNSSGFSLVIGGIACLFSKDRYDTFKKWSIGSFCVWFPLALIVPDPAPIKKTKLIKYQGNWIDPYKAGFKSCGDYYFLINDFDFLQDWAKVRKSKNYEDWEVFLEKHRDRYVSQQTKNSLEALRESKTETERSFEENKLPEKNVVEADKDSNFIALNSDEDESVDVKTSNVSVTDQPNPFRKGVNYFGVGPCRTSIGGDFNGESFFLFTAPYIYSGFTYIPKIEPGIGGGITLGGFWMTEYSEFIGLSVKASYIRSSHKARWDDFEMDVTYSGLLIGGGCFFKISNKILWQWLISYSFDNIKIKYSESREFVFGNQYSWSTITVDPGESGLRDSFWNPIPLNIGTEINWIINKNIMFYIGIDYQMQSHYDLKGTQIGKRYYLNNDGTELEWKGGLSSKMIRISAGITGIWFD